MYKWNAVRSQSRLNGVHLAASPNHNPTHVLSGYFSVIRGQQFWSTGARRPPHYRRLDYGSSKGPFRGARYKREFAVFLQPVTARGVTCACNHASREQSDELSALSHQSGCTEEKSHGAASSDRDGTRATACGVGGSASTREWRIEQHRCTGCVPCPPGKAMGSVLI